jgi:hypothetical protein
LLFVRADNFHHVKTPLVGPVAQHTRRENDFKNRKVNARKKSVRLSRTENARCAGDASSVSENLVAAG